MAYRLHEHRYHNGRPDAGWALDDETLTSMRLAKVHLIAVWVRDTGEIYLAERWKFHRPDLSHAIDYSRHTGAGGHKGSAQRVLHFKDKAGNDNFYTLTGTHRVR